MLIETPRLIIRNFVSEDLDGLYAVLSDPEVMRFSLSGTFSIGQTKQFLLNCMQAYREIRYGQYALVFKESNQLIGYCGFFNQAIEDKNEIELAYRLARPFWGQGFATEAAIACRDYAFSELPIERLITIIDPENTAAVRVAENAGLIFEGKVIFNGLPCLLYSVQKTQNKPPLI